MPNTLFISYSRKQQDKAIQLDNIKLNQFYWWMDYRIVGTVDWWKNICEAIEECYCMVALMSKTYSESVYCMGELVYALKLNKPVLCIMLEDGVTYPAELDEKRVQYTNMHNWDVNQVVQVILESMYRVERDYNERVYHRDISLRPYLRPSVPTPPKAASAEDAEIAEKVHRASAQPSPPIRVGEAIIQATQALDSSNYQRVIDLLEPVRPHAKESDQEIIHDMLREARLGQDYAKIAALVKSSRMQKHGCAQYKQFRQTYPDYPDEQSLRSSCPTSIELMPQPFEWIEIQGGQGTLQANSFGVTLAIPERRYWIAKYPITNAQFAKFMDAKGYSQQKWWTPDGWQVCEKEQWTQPHFWEDNNWNGAEQPVVGVSWYEAVAYCLWLSDITGENIMLPTEAQWQYAAQGDDGRAYPWGNTWDCTRCNNSVDPCRHDKTTPVTNYTGKGESPFKVVDMAGNVWEWCLTAHKSGRNDVSGTDVRVLRGGSWLDFNSGYLRCGACYVNNPHNGNSLSGFRVSRSD